MTDTNENKVEGLPEGFDSLADYVAHNETLKADHDKLSGEHKELRTKMSKHGAPGGDKDEESKKEEAAKKAAAEKAAAEKEAAEKAAAEKEAKEKGGDEEETEEKGGDDQIVITADQANRMRSEIENDGALSDASVEELKKLGLDESTIQRQAGLVAAEVLRDKKIYDACGGKDLFDTAVAWAQENMTQEERTAAQALLSSTSMETAKQAALDLVSRCRADSPPNLVHGVTSGGADVPEKVTTLSDVGKLTADKRYLRDAEYTRKVQKLMAGIAK